MNTSPSLQHSNTPALHLFDAHNHLHDERFGGRQAELITTARKAGVVRMVVNGSCEEDWPHVLELARTYPDLVLPSFGYHPWYVRERTPDWERRLADFLDATPSAVGEIGLDRWKSFLPWKGQEEIFSTQLRMAAERNRPASIHCLKAWGPLVAALERGPRPACGFVLHSYGGSAELVERLAPLGAYFSLPGYFAHERKVRQREAFLAVPRDRLLIETDAPDQAPPEPLIRYPMAGGANGKPLNHPANVRAVYDFAASLLGEPVEALAAQVEANFTRLFGG